MVTTYDFLKRIENDSTFVIALKKGLIPLNVLSYKCYYEKYKEELKNNKQCDAISNAAEEYNINPRTVRRAIKFMES